MQRPLLALLLAVNLPVAAQAAEPAVPEWIWANESRELGQTACFRSVFNAPTGLKSAELQGMADFCALTISLNGKNVSTIPSFGTALRLDVTPYLKPGENILAVRGTGVSGPSALFLRLEMQSTNGIRNFLMTDHSWSATTNAGPNWETDTSAANWHPAVSFGAIRRERLAESSNDIAIGALDNYEQWKQAIGAQPGTDSFAIVPGFQIELLHAATKDEGSWISLAFDPKGRVIVAKEAKGLLRLTLPATTNGAIQVETINDTLEECRGLLFAFDSLYVNANKSKGLYRLRDTQGNGRFDEVKLLMKTEAGGHGRNDLALGPDNMIYQIAGDTVDFPKETSKSTPPVVTNLMAGERLPRGHLIRTDSEGKTWELVSGGLRNPFGIDFNTDGEAFTYDADAEHDMGSPWYRPTRIHHLVSGADFGWRRVTGSWPPYYPDHVDEPPLTLDIGKGSPTAVKFGTRSHFPPAYQRALFALDWAYGRILAVHLFPQGASYTGRAKTFLRGRPLNVTDLDFGPDGAMYFVTGGRNTQSGLYRVRFVGPPVNEPSPSAHEAACIAYSREARALRHQLETFHWRQDSLAIQTAWPHLANPDPWIAHAARVAIEHYPWESWQSRALTESTPTVTLTALMSLARVGPDDLLAKIVERLNGFTPAGLNTAEKMMLIRICDISRLRGTSRESLAPLTARLDPLLPDASAEVNHDLAALLASVESPGIVQKLLALLATAETQESKLHYLFLLRNVRNGWTDADRAKYFRALAQTDSFRGGEGLPKFLRQIKAEAETAVPETQRAQFSAMLNNPQSAETTPPTEPRPFVRAWTLSDLADSLAAVASGRNFDQGRKVFATAMCIRCHQLGREGRAFGPDLTEVAGRFSRRDILESILQPSLVVAENYRNVMVKTKSGETIMGRLALEGDYRLPVLRIAENPLTPEKLTDISKSEIASYTESPVSPMPEGLLNSFTREEILDLLAYLEAGGDASRPNFRP